MSQYHYRAAVIHLRRFQAPLQSRLLSSVWPPRLPQLLRGLPVAAVSCCQEARRRMLRYAPLLDPWLTDVSCAALVESSVTARNVSNKLAQLSIENAKISAMLLMLVQGAPRIIKENCCNAVSD